MVEQVRIGDLEFAAHAAEAQVAGAEYQAGHMMYLDAASLAKLKKDVSAFLQETLKRK